MSTHAADPISPSEVRQTPWRIDPARSSVEFHSRTFWGMVTVKGHFDRFQGTLDLSKQTAIALTIEAASLDTSNKKRDTHLRSRDFFDVEKNPYVRFTSESAALDDEKLKVRGRLRARGSSIPLELEATLKPVGDELEVEAVTEVDHHALGMIWNQLGMLRTPSKLIVKGRLVRDVG